jgi:hypothetical protein
MRPKSIGHIDGYSLFLSEGTGWGGLIGEGGEDEERLEMKRSALSM